jgi:hypothetical protein
MEILLMNKYTATSLVLITIGTVLVTQKPEFYLDIVVLSFALVFGIAGYQKGKA